MKSLRKKTKAKKGLPEYTYLGCPMTSNRSPWCFRLCMPDAKGKGRCGRLAPHTLKGRTQLAIEAHKKKLLKAHMIKLENMYLTAVCNKNEDPDINISEGAAEINVKVQQQFLDPLGHVHPSIYFKIMNDSALSAVNSVIEKAAVETISFNTYLTRPATQSQLVARGRFMGVSGSHYLAESVLTDQNGQEIARGNGSYVKSRISLTPKIGYQ